MANNTLTVALRFQAQNRDLLHGLNSSRSAMSRFTRGVKSEFAALKSAAQSFAGQLAQIGLAVSAFQTLRQSSGLDRDLTKIGLSADASAAQVLLLRRELHAMAKETGREVDDLKKGFESLVQSGQSWAEALETTRAINRGSAVTGADERTLAAGLSVGAQAFQFDLGKPGQALALLDKMTVAGRLGNAELENLSDVFARVGVNAQSAGLSFDKTLAFIEALSLVERSPERLATLADSTLRLFNNLDYAREASKATGVKFFNKDGTRRDALAVFNDLKTAYGKLKTDIDRAKFIDSAFGKADLDTQKGLKTLLSGDFLQKIAEFEARIANAAGTLQNNLSKAIDNATDQVGRLKATLGEAADAFAKPINEALTKTIKFGLDSKEKGGLGLTGNDLIVGGGLGALGALLAARYGGKALAALGGKLSGLGGGVAVGKALEEVAGVTPVFVTNWPGAGSTATDALLEGTTAGAVLKSFLGKARELFNKPFAGSLLGMSLGEVVGTGAVGLGISGALAALFAGGGYMFGKDLNQEWQGTPLMDFLDSAIAKPIADAIDTVLGKEVNVAVTVDVKNGNIVAEVNKANSREAKRY
ncbi:phage tail tape measure protein [Methylocaldum gracile subsp. desertum]|uniref:phage tail tape measure protein n=1 Tax=Methylocaldum sp. GT1BW TaxID=3438964 RepID=UPI003DA0862A